MEIHWVPGMGLKRINRSSIVTSDTNIMKQIENTFSNISIIPITEKTVFYTFDKAPNLE